MIVREELLRAIRGHASESYPEECCGFLLGIRTESGNHVTRALRVENSQQESRERRYIITPGDYLRADRQARSEDLDIVGIYHSHPDHPARPSETDLAQATFPGYSYVIVSVRQGEPEEITSWLLSDDRSRFDAEPVQVDNE